MSCICVCVINLIPTAAPFREEVSKVGLGGSRGPLKGFQRSCVVFSLFYLSDKSIYQQWPVVQELVLIFFHLESLACPGVFYSLIEVWHGCCLEKLMKLQFAKTAISPCIFLTTWFAEGLVTFLAAIGWKVGTPEHVAHSYLWAIWRHQSACNMQFD